MKIATIARLALLLSLPATGMEFAHAQQQAVPPAPRITLEEAKTAMEGDVPGRGVAR